MQHLDILSYLKVKLPKAAWASAFAVVAVIITTVIAVAVLSKIQFIIVSKRFFSFIE